VITANQGGHPSGARPKIASISVTLRRSDLEKVAAHAHLVDYDVREDGTDIDPIYQEHAPTFRNLPGSELRSSANGLPSASLIYIVSGIAIAARTRPHCEFATTCLCKAKKTTDWDCITVPRAGKSQDHLTLSDLAARGQVDRVSRSTNS
jgi:hypothetical protein